MLDTVAALVVVAIVGGGLWMAGFYGGWRVPLWVQAGIPAVIVAAFLAPNLRLLATKRGIQLLLRDGALSQGQVVAIAEHSGHEESFEATVRYLSRGRDVRFRIRLPTFYEPALNDLMTKHRPVAVLHSPARPRRAILLEFLALAR